MILISAFLFIFLEIYNTHRPLGECRVEDKNKGKPWMTKGWQRARKKKNLPYKKFFQLRTGEIAEKHKLYKKKMPSIIIRLQKKEYYSKILEYS